MSLRKVVIHVQDTRYVGSWPSYVEGLCEWLKCTGGGELIYVDQTMDGWFGDAQLSDPPNLTVTRIASLSALTVPAGYALVGCESQNVDLQESGVKASLATYTGFSKEDQILVFGPHNGLQAADFPQTVDDHIYIDGYEPGRSVPLLECITLVTDKRYQQQGW